MVIRIISQRDRFERLAFILRKILTKAIAMSANLVPSPEVHVIPAGGVNSAQYLKIINTLIIEKRRWKDDN